MEHAQVIVIGGGQSGLAAAGALRARGLAPLVLEAGEEAVGSWPSYYDSLTLFSPARFSSLPGLELDGVESYPRRDEVVDYLRRYAEHLQVDIRTRTRVTAVESDGTGFTLRTGDGAGLTTRGIVAATGSFATPVRPELPGQEDFTGRILHVADYREPEPFAGHSVIVVGGGNSAVQIGHELSAVTETVLATRAPLHFLPRTPHGRDLHHWATSTGFDLLPPQWLARFAGGTLVLDEGTYRQAVESGALERRPLFTGLEGDTAVWPDGSRSRADTVLLATGYRPNLDYLRPPGALDESGAPLHSGGLSLTHPGLVYLGLEFQRSFASQLMNFTDKIFFVYGPVDFQPDECVPESPL